MGNSNDFESEGPRMLVLSRREHEEIAIGDDIIVRVVEIGRGKVRLAIDAPRHVSIMRTELLSGEGENAGD